MPLRNHFADPDRPTWEPVHGGWPMVIIQYLARKLPPRYQIHPKIHVGDYFEIDIGTIDTEPDLGLSNWGTSGGIVTLTLPTPALTEEAERDNPSEYEVTITDLHDGTLVAVIELVSPSNKDRPSNRKEFVTKCQAFLDRGVCVTIVDLVTCRDFNLYAELLLATSHQDPTLPVPPPAIYAATLRERRLSSKRVRFESWSNTLHIGQPLPMLPVFVGDTDWVPLELEATYEETCQTLRLR